MSWPQLRIMINLLGIRFKDYQSRDEARRKKQKKNTKFNQILIRILILHKKIIVLEDYIYLRINETYVHLVLDSKFYSQNA